MDTVSEAYADTVGSMVRNWPAAFDTVIHLDCPNCGAVPFEVCMYSPARARRAPCVTRK